MKISVALLLSLLLIPAYAEEAHRSLDDLMQQYHELGQFNGATLVIEDGKTLLRNAYGFADFEEGIANSPETRFGIGSMSKSFTALLVAQLAVNGKLDLDATISDYLPDYRADAGEKVTLSQLLAHTDGIPNYTQSPAFREPAEGPPESTAEYITQFGSGDLMFEPGTQYRYGNAGYSILGAIVETVTGQDFIDVMSEQVIKPLDLDDTGFIRTQRIEGMANGYEQSVGGFRPVTVLPRPLFAAGSMFSRIDDVARYGSAVVDSDGISDAVTELLLQSRNGAVEGTFAYGWNSMRTTLGGVIDEQQLAMTSGELNGFNSLFVYLPESDQLLVLLNNTGETNLVDMATNILLVINDQQPQAVRPRLRDILYRLVDAGDMDVVAGFYREERETNANDYIYAPWALRIVAIQLRDVGRVDDAIRVLELNLETHPGDVPSTRLLSELRQ